MYREIQQKREQEFLKTHQYITDITFIVVIAFEAFNYSLFFFPLDLAKLKVDAKRKMASYAQFWLCQAPCNPQGCEAC